MKRLKLILIITAILLLITLAVAAVLQNLAPARLEFLFFKGDVPVIIIIIVSLFCGFLLGLLFFSIFSRIWKKEVPPKEKKAKDKKALAGAKNGNSLADDQAMIEALKKPVKEKRGKR